MNPIELGIIGGSGLYDMADLKDVEERAVTTPFGAPSDAFTIGTLHGRRVAFLPRHGRGHRLSPSEVPYRANVYAFKKLGVKYLISVSACGSLRESIAPGHIVIPDQLFDNTKGVREGSFFGAGLVAHVGVAQPFSPELSAVLAVQVAAVGATAHQGGTFITIEGPRFSTRGESVTFRSWGMSIVGMTTSPEAFLAAEAEIAYGCLAHVTDYDVWHESEEPVTVDMVMRTVAGNTRVIQQALRRLIATMAAWEGEFAAHSGLKDAIITARDQIAPAQADRLDLLVGRYLN